MMCSFFVCSVHFLFAAFIFCLQRSFFVCSVHFLFAAFVFCLQRFCYLQHRSLIAALVFYLQRTLLCAAFAFCLQRFLFVCSVSFLFATCPLWAIVSPSSKTNCFEKTALKKFCCFANKLRPQTQSTGFPDNRANQRLESLLPCAS